MKRNATKFARNALPRISPSKISEFNVRTEFDSRELISEKHLLPHIAPDGLNNPSEESPRNDSHEGDADEKLKTEDQKLHAKSERSGFVLHSSKSTTRRNLNVEEHRRDESRWQEVSQSKCLNTNLIECKNAIFFKQKDMVDPFLASKEHRRMQKWVGGRRDVSNYLDKAHTEQRSRSCPPMEFEMDTFLSKTGPSNNLGDSRSFRIQRHSTVGLSTSIQPSSSHHSIEALRRAAENAPLKLRAFEPPPLTPLMDERVVAERLFKGLSAWDSGLLAAHKIQKQQGCISPKDLTKENVRTTQLATSAMIRAHAASLDKRATLSVEASVNEFCEDGDNRLCDMRNISKGSILLFDQRLGGLRKLKGDFDVISIKNDSVQRSAYRLGVEMQKIEAFLRSGLDERVRKVFEMPELQELKTLNLITYESNKRRTLLNELYKEVASVRKDLAIKSESLAKKFEVVAKQVEEHEQKLTSLLIREENQVSLTDAEVREIKVLKETIANMYLAYQRDPEISDLEGLTSYLLNLFVEMEAYACQEEDFARRTLQEHEAGAQYRAQVHEQEALDDMKKKIAWLMQENPPDVAHAAAKNISLMLQRILDEPDVPEHRKLNSQNRVSLLPKVLDARFGQDVLFSIGFFLYASKGLWILPSETPSEHFSAALRFLKSELESEHSNVDAASQRKVKKRTVLSVSGVHKRGSVSLGYGVELVKAQGETNSASPSVIQGKKDDHSVDTDTVLDSNLLQQYRVPLTDLHQKLVQHPEELVTANLLKATLNVLQPKLPEEIESLLIKALKSIRQKVGGNFVAALGDLIEDFPDADSAILTLDREKEEKMKKLLSRWCNELTYDSMRSWRYFAEKMHEERDRILLSYGGLCDRLNIPSLAMIPLTQILHSHKQSELDISGRGISSAGIKALLCAIYGRSPDFQKSISSKVSRENDRFADIRDEELFAVKLEHLDLFRMRLVMSFAPLKRLILKNNDFKATGAQALVQVLTGCDVDLDELNMESNNIGEQGGEAIAKLLSFVPARPVRRLILSRNKLGDAGASAILLALANSVQLRQTLSASDYLIHLDLSRNEVSDATASQAGNLLSEPKVYLQSLDLGWNLIRNEAATVLFEGLRGNRNLKVLNLEWNGLGSSNCCHQIGEALASCALSTLNLTRCRITAAGTSLISNGLVKNKDLQYLIMDGNSIMQTGARILFKAKMECNRGEGQPLTISTNDCNIEMKDASCFDAAEPGGVYSLDMKLVYNRQVLLELMRLVNKGKGKFLPIPAPEIDEAYDGTFKPYKKLVLDTKVEEDWWIPDTGILNFSFGNNRVAASQDNSLATSDREWDALGDQILDPETSSKNWISIIRAQISGDTFLRYDQAASLLSRIDQESGNGTDRSAISALRIEIIKHCYNRLVDPERNFDLLELLTAQERPSVEKYLGVTAKNFTQNNPTGFYSLNLGMKSEREVLFRLIEVHNAQLEFWVGTKSWFASRAGGPRPEVEVCWRNARFDGHPHQFSNAWPVPSSGIYQVDFVVVRKPSPDTIMPTHDEVEELMSSIRTYHNESERLAHVRRWSNFHCFKCEQVDLLLESFQDEASRVELIVIAFARTLDWHGFTNLLSLLNGSELKLLRYRLSIVNLFDDNSAVGYYELDLAIPEERFVSQELVQLAIVEPGDNIVDCQYNGMDMTITGGWAKLMPTKGLLSFYYCREKECIKEVAICGAWKQSGHPHCVNGLVAPQHRSTYRSWVLGNLCEEGLIQPAGTSWIRAHKLRSILLKMKAVASSANEMFKLLDRDGGGSLDSRELAAGLFRLGVWLHPLELQALVQVLDSDGGGTISEDEFVEVWESVALKKPETASPVAGEPQL